MELSFILIVFSSLVVLGFLILLIFRNVITTDKFSENLVDGNEPLKYIPKKIFQLIFDKSKVNPQFQKNIEYIKKLNPDWSYNLYDENDKVEYLTTNYPPEILELFTSINPKYGAARADFFRYLLMYREGGVYIDIKSAMKFPLNNIIWPDDEYILSHWNWPCQGSILNSENGEFQQWHIICRPQHPFLAAVIKNVIENIKTYRISDGVGKPGVLKVTGPIAYTEAILPILNQYNHRLIESNDYIGLIYNNLKESHIKLFSNGHYSKISEPIIIKK